MDEKNTKTDAWMNRWMGVWLGGRISDWGVEVTTVLTWGLCLFCLDRV